MQIETWLQRQRELYTQVSQEDPTLSIHPLSGQWQESAYLRSQLWWGGGATQETAAQLEGVDPNLNQLGVLTFGPVQTFLGGGQRLRDWAVSSWLCHYLSAVVIYHWERRGGKVLLPLHRSVPLVQWLKKESFHQDESFWQAELPNIFTGIFPNEKGWLEEIKDIVQREWSEFVRCLEQSAISYERTLLNGVGWQVIRGDCQHLWSVYISQAPLNISNPETITATLAKLHQHLEAQKIGRSWQKQWWAGKTSPSAGSLSVWHPGLKPIDKGGTWGLPEDNLKNWWQKLSQRRETHLAGLFSSSDRLNSLEMVKRLASIPEIIRPTLTRLWVNRDSLPFCPWERFPDRTAAAAAWIGDAGVDPQVWNQKISALEKDYFPDSSSKKKEWGMPRIDSYKQFDHPRALERRNVDDHELLEIWDSDVTKGWESTIEWTVGWRGDGDKFSEWLSGEKYKALKLLWSQWHLTPEIINQENLVTSQPNVPSQARKIDLPHMLDISVLFGLWNKLLYALTEKHHNGKVIFAGGDDFLLLGPLTDAVSLTSNLHSLWQGEENPLTTAMSLDGWVNYEEQVYPVPGKQMTFSLGLVIAQRRIPQSLWHRTLNAAYKKAKEAGRERVCVEVLFNSGQSLQWTCPWKLWHLLMGVEAKQQDKTELNVWEKLLFYLETTNLEINSPQTVKELLDTLWASVGLPLQWSQIEQLGAGKNLRQEIGSWQWWRNWLALRGFLARQDRERETWLEGVISD